ncbi:Scr1 family TA system antitoxin-like transcriptional regulator [Kitasatospora sp. NPDC096147]|uniref:helix-turn-helix domain-containing protein n=1 Tax=Kitasatospora sp. NPDC096147 TaxID=3364093 RepID=UPI00382ED4C9
MTEQEVDVPSSSAIRFGEELRKSRRAKGWSQTELGRRMGFSNTLVSYVELGRRPATRNFAVAADTALKTPETFYLLWRTVARAALLEGFTEFAEAEARCRQWRTFELGVIPGLFQTPAYSAALESASVARGRITQAQADERLRFLTGRQRLLGQKRPPKIHAVMDESCLTSMVGGPQVMAEQLRHIEALVEHAHITVQVAPASLGEHRVFLLPVVLLTQADRSVIAYAESQLRGQLERDRRAVAVWEDDYDHLQREAPSERVSLEMIRAVRRDLE